VSVRTKAKRRRQQTLLEREGWTVVRLRRGARIIAGPDVVSEIRARPGPTHSLFDILAACIAGLAPGPRAAVLGFAGGGLMAPLRGMGYASRVEAVDLSEEGTAVFDELCGSWAGPVTVHHDEASRWLRRQRRAFDVIVEDLSIPGPGGMSKPRVSREVLPELIRDRLSPQGIVATNLLPESGRSLPSLVRSIAAPWPRTLILDPHDYENLIVLAGPGLGAARETSRLLRSALSRIESSQRHLFSLREAAGGAA
jgi:hypothetical protein